MKNTQHTFQAKITHHEYNEMDVDIEHCRSDDEPKISVRVEDGLNSRITITLDELRELVRLGERFETAHRTLKGEDHE